MAGGLTKTSPESCRGGGRRGRRGSCPPCSRGRSTRLFVAPTTNRYLALNVKYPPLPPPPSNQQTNQVTPNPTPIFSPRIEICVLFFSFVFFYQLLFFFQFLNQKKVQTCDACVKIIHHHLVTPQTIYTHTAPYLPPLKPLKVCFIERQ